MADVQPAGLSRVCPACGRRVRPPALECRCGKSVDGLPLTAAPVRAQPAPPPDRTSLVKAAKFGLALVALLASGFWFTRTLLTRRDAVTPRNVTTAAPLPKPATPSSAAATASAPASPATPADAPQAAEPTALERVMAAAAASKRANGEPVAPPSTGSPAALEDMIGRALPAVVRVETPGGFGSGFFIASDTLLTNAHVVGSNTTVSIRRPDGAMLPGRVDVSAPELDIAIVRTSRPDPSQATLTMGSGARARAGQEVVALGSPLGLQNTVTRGIVSAVRDVGALTMVQTDAAINPGNSGGPLLDRAGLVIAITTLGVKPSEAQGLSFAVAIEHAQALLEGRRSTDPKGTPLSTLNEAMSGRATTPPTAAGQDRAAKTYEETIAAQAQRANALDEQWRAFKRICYQGRIADTPGHEWFALWDPAAMQGTVPPGCASAFGDIRRAADSIRDAVVAAGEAARQADLYPGVRRDLLRRYRLDYPGWDK
jgi:S1-C subfamily serine protease